LNQTHRRANQISIVPRLLAVWKCRDVFQTRTDAVPSFEGALIDFPARHAVTVVNLLKLDACAHHNVLHIGGMLNSSIVIFVQRLNQDAVTALCQSRTHEAFRVLSGQQSSLYTHSSRQQQLA